MRLASCPSGLGRRCECEEVGGGGRTGGGLRIRFRLRVRPCAASFARRRARCVCGQIDALHAAMDELRSHHEEEMHHMEESLSKKFKAELNLHDEVSESQLAELSKENAHLTELLAESKEQ